MSSRLRRRDLLRLGVAVAGSALTSRLYAAPASGPRFLLVFLRGGYDATNMLVPYSSDFYYEARPNIAIARPEPGQSAGAVALDSEWALAPALRDTLMPMYQQRQVAFVPFAGTDDLSRSHFETQDSVELGQPVGETRDYRSGFMARLSGVLTAGAGPGATPIAFTDALPLCFQGPAQVANLSLRNIGKSPFDERQSRILTDMYAGHALQPAVLSGLELRAEMAQAMAEEMTASSRSAINTKGFELEAERMGKLMRDTYRLGFIDVGGWDTHVNEGSAQGALATNLTGVGRGLTAFAGAMGADWNNTVVVVVSEFGRTFRENGNRGTDHGHGTVYWVLGGGLNGGRVAGEQQPVTRASLFQDRDYPVLNDYRAVLGGLFRVLWSLNPAQLQQIFPRVQSTDLQLV
jgi:uncharacterized protein (DUF1501 family)